MELKGKLLCGLAGLFIGDLLGLPFGGLLGFILGSIIGHFQFDKPKETAASAGEYKAYQRRQGAFIFHVFRLCAKMAKSDGAVNNAEVSHMEQIMRQHFRMSDRRRQQAIRVWKQAKDSTAWAKLPLAPVRRLGRGVQGELEEEVLLPSLWVPL